MRKQRTPFAGLGVVVRRAADECVPAIGFFYEEGGAETSDELMACAMEKLKSRKPKAETEGFCNFQAHSMAVALGHRLSM